MYAISREFDFFELKKHYCPKCEERLKKVKISKIINKKSPEAKNYDFSMCGDTGVRKAYYFGNVKFIKTAFFCEKCNRQYKISELKKLYFKK